MSKFQLLALLLFSAQASAEWELVGEDENVSMYMDKSTIRKQGLYNAMWIMADYNAEKKSDEGTYWSVKYLYLYNCRDRTEGVKALASYGGKMGSGKVVFSYSRQPFEVKFIDVLLDSVGETMLDAACGN